MKTFQYSILVDFGEFLVSLAVPIPSGEFAECLRQRYTETGREVCRVNEYYIICGN